MKIVLDTNVYISAFLSKGLASDILKLGRGKRIYLFASDEILVELEDKLIHKFGAEEKMIKEFVELVKMCAKVITPKKKLLVIEIDLADNKILECAVEAGANLIVTMDKHLLKLKSYKNIGIVHPKTLTWIIPKLLG